MKKYLFFIVFFFTAVSFVAADTASGVFYECIFVYSDDTPCVEASIFLSKYYGYAPILLGKTDGSGSIRTRLASEFSHTTDKKIRNANKLLPTLAKRGKPVVNDRANSIIIGEIIDHTDKNYMFWVNCGDRLWCGSPLSSLRIDIKNTITIPKGVLRKLEIQSINDAYNLDNSILLFWQEQDEKILITQAHCRTDNIIEIFLADGNYKVFALVPQESVFLCFSPVEYSTTGNTILLGKTLGKIKIPTQYESFHIEPVRYNDENKLISPSFSQLPDVLEEGFIRSSVHVDQNEATDIFIAKMTSKKKNYYICISIIQNEYVSLAVMESD